MMPLSCKESGSSIGKKIKARSAGVSVRTDSFIAQSHYRTEPILSKPGLNSTTDCCALPSLSRNRGAMRDRSRSNLQRVGRGLVQGLGRKPERNRERRIPGKKLHKGTDREVKMEQSEYLAKCRTPVEEAASVRQ